MERDIKAIAKARVAEGMAYLDAEIPNWHERIDVPTLNIQYPGACILGQLFGSYSTGLKELWGPGATYWATYWAADGSHDTVRLGFSAEDTETMAALTDEWAWQIHMRQEH